MKTFHIALKQETSTCRSGKNEFSEEKNDIHDFCV